MKIGERIKKIKKTVGDKVSYRYSDELFTQNSDYAEILDVHFNGIDNVGLVVLCKGTVNPIGTIKSYKVDRQVRLPLVHSNAGRLVFSQYECNGESLKNIFFTNNDIHSSPFREWNQELIDDLEEELRKLRLNMGVKKQFLVTSELKQIQSIYKVSSEESVFLKNLGLSPYGWRNTLEDIYYFDDNRFDFDLVWDLNHNKEKIEEVLLNLEILKLTKQRKR